MDKLKVTKVPDVRLQRRWRHDTVVLHLTQHHFIFQFDRSKDSKGKGKEPDRGVLEDDDENDELWVPYHVIAQVTRLPSLLPHSVQRQQQQQWDVIRLPHSGSAAEYPADAWASSSSASAQRAGPSNGRASGARQPYVTQGRVFPLVVHLRNFESFGLGFASEQAATDVFDSVKACAVLSAMNQLHAFHRKELSDPTPPPPSRGWGIYDCKKEFARQGVGSRTKAWRFTDINADYTFCSTYPGQLVVPSRISDSTLAYAAKYRSKARIPALSYLHWANFGSITRSSQPMVGLNRNRSVQDEKLIEAIFTSHHFTDPHSPAALAAVTTGSGASDLNPNSGFTVSAGDRLQSASPQARPGSAQGTAEAPAQPTVYGATSTNLIIDARPTTNAMANVAKGAGTENMDHYRGCKKAYLGVDNIHVMRDSLTRVVDALRDGDVPLVFEASEHGSSDALPLIDHALLKRSNWLKHISALLEGSMLIVRNVHINSSHVLIHCSDGWDRTSQLSAIAQVCLDPYYRTIDGFAVLVEKDWLSFGHRFLDRSGHLGHEKFFTTASGHGEPDSDEEEKGDLDGAATAFWGFTKSLTASLGGGGGHSVSHTHLKEMSPVFHQFLDCVWQIYRQFPTRFEFSPSFLIELQRQLHMCKYGTFLYNCEKDRRQPDQLGIPKAAQSSTSVWDYMLDEKRRAAWANASYDKELDDPKREHADMGVLLADARDVRFFAGLFKRGDVEMNKLIEEEIEEKRRFREAQLATEKASLEAAAPVPDEAGAMKVGPAITSSEQDPVLNPLAAVTGGTGDVSARDLGTNERPVATPASSGSIGYKAYQPRQRPAQRPAAPAAQAPAQSGDAAPVRNFGSQYVEQAQALAQSDGAQRVKAFLSAGWGRIQDTVNAQLTEPAPSQGSPSQAPRPLQPEPHRAPAPAPAPPSAANPWARHREDLPSDVLKDSTLTARHTVAPGAQLGRTAGGGNQSQSTTKQELDPLGALG